jgi:hypothetical protein
VRHAITTLAVVNGAALNIGCYLSLADDGVAGKVYTLTVGSSEGRWAKISDRLKFVANSFSLAGY